jgi:hypothetical protein
VYDTENPPTCRRGCGFGFHVRMIWTGLRHSSTPRHVSPDCKTLSVCLFERLLEVSSRTARYVRSVYSVVYV